MLHLKDLAHCISLPSPPVFIATLTEEQKLSKNSLPLGTPSDVIHEATIRLPRDLSAVVPPNVSRKTEFAEFSANYSFKDSVLHGTVHLKTLLREVPGEKRSDFSSLATTINDSESRYIPVNGKFPDGDNFQANLMGLDPSTPEVMISRLEEALADNPNNRMGLFMLSQAYTRAGRPKDAVAILEKALADTPEDAGGLYFALGQAYLAVPDTDKAMANYRKALGDDPKPALLNSIAYSLSEANVHLKEALEFSTRAVSSLSEQTMDISPDSAQPRDYALMRQLAANWDTFGWIKFRLGDSPAAEKYLKASWQLMQSAEIGEHLVEAYERSGQKGKAAEVCHLANPALGHNASPDNNLREKLTAQMTRLRPFLKSASPVGSNSSRRSLPDAYAALTDMRSINIPLRTKLRGESGRATFAISLLNGPKVDEVIFLSGSEELRAAVPALSSAKYSLSFPDDVPTRALLKANLNCSVYSKDCLLFISTVTEAATSSVPVQLNVAPQ